MFKGNIILLTFFKKKEKNYEDVKKLCRKLLAGKEGLGITTIVSTIFPARTKMLTFNMIKFELVYSFIDNYITFILYMWQQN